MAQSQITVVKLYQCVIDDVISGVREAFLDEGVDEQVLLELKQIWESKLASSKAVESNPEPAEPQPPQMSSQRENARNKVPNNSANVKKTEQIVPTQTIYTPQQSTHQQQQQMTQQIPQSSQQPQTTTVISDPNKLVPIQITLPAQAGAADSQQRVLTIQVPMSALQNNVLQSVLTGPVISATMALPHHLAASLLQQHVTAALQGQAQSQATNLHQLAGQAVENGRAAFQQGVRQLDGINDTSDEDEDDEDDDDIDDEDDADDKEDDENEEEEEGQEEEPLNSEDDVSDEDPLDLFDTDNVVVCQYDKITRSRNKWKFYLKDGIMNLNGKDFVFQKSNGDAEW